MDISIKLIMAAAIAFACLIAWAVHSDNAQRAAMVAAFKDANCKVIGDAADDGSTTNLRTIYQCPDGLIHIR